MEWKKRRDERLVQAQEVREAEEEQSCTFRPSIHNVSIWKGPEKAAELSDFGKKGLVQYIERVDNARKKKQEKSLNTRYGDKWENKITVPREFNFKTTNKKVERATSKSKENKVLVLIDERGNERHLEEKSMSIDYIPIEGRVKGNGQEFEYALYNLHQKLHNFNF